MVRMCLGAVGGRCPALNLGHRGKTLNDSTNGARWALPFGQFIRTMRCNIMYLKQQRGCSPFENAAISALFVVQVTRARIST
eukprot:1195491-Prorocentrum_minimum.AAC.3